MKKYYQLLLALGVVALVSCSRANYAFNPAGPSYLGAGRAHSVAVKPIQAQPVPAPATIGNLSPASVSFASVEAIRPTVAAPEATGALRATPKPAPVQRLLLRKVARSLTKIQAGSQNTARVEHTASETGRSALIALAGLVLSIIGLALAASASSVATAAFPILFGALLLTIGYIVLIIGLVMLAVHLIKKD